MARGAELESGDAYREELEGEDGYEVRHGSDAPELDSVKPHLSRAQATGFHAEAPELPSPPN